MSYAKWMAILAVAVSTVGCRPPCQAVAAEAIVMDETCANASRRLKDTSLAIACGVAYNAVREALITGSCAAEVGKR